MQDLEQRLHAYEPLWGEWTLGQRLYAGSATAVYEITRHRLDQTLSTVVKVQEIVGSEEECAPALARVMDEIERMERLQGCHYIVRCLEDSIIPRREDQGVCLGYDVLMRLEHLSCLADDVREGHIFSEKEVLALGRQISLALTAAHSRGIVHRDIKPGNLYRSDDGRFLLGDFGVSGAPDEQEQLRTVAGTVAYMAPEVAGGVYDKRADIYSLGLVLYQLLNDNFLPFTDENSTYSQRENAVRKRRQGQAIPRPRRGSRRLWRTVRRALSWDPNQRFPSAAALRAALGEPGAGMGRAALRRVLMGVLICLACVGLGALAGWLAGAGRSTAGENALPVTPDVTYTEETAANSTYEVIKNDLSWEKARVYCESRGGHLATITSRKEEENIISLLEEAGVTAAWLGADNLNAANGFQWLTGERFSYAAWGLNEPNNTSGGESYLMLMHRGEEGWVWNDSSSNGLLVFPTDSVGFVCEWDEPQ